MRYFRNVTMFAEFSIYLSIVMSEEYMKKKLVYLQIINDVMK